MNLGRLLRTVGHLTPEQIIYGVARRGRHTTWRRRSHAARSKHAAAAARLPALDPLRPAVRRIADSVELLQRTVHPDATVDLRAARFKIWGREIKFDGLAELDWRWDSGEGNSPLLRLTLAYFGWAVPLLAEGKSEDLRHVAQAVVRLDAVPWSEPGIFRDLWNPYTASHRLINLLCGLNLYGRALGTADAEPVQRLHDHIRRCAAFVVSDPERDIQANHLFKNWTALAVYAAATATPKTVFPSLAHEIRRGLDQLVLDDGGHAERSPMYHALGLIDVEIIRASDAVPALELQLANAATALRRALGVLSHPDGDIALFNDAWLGGAPTSAALGIDAPRPGVHTLPNTGYVRLDGGRDVVIFDCGPCGLDCQPGHAHADFLSFELSLAGTRFIVDPGTATYTAGELRDRVRSAGSHNGPYLIGHEPIELWRSFRVGRRATAGILQGAGLESIAPLWCAGWHNGYRHVGVSARRWLGLWPGQAALAIDIWPGADVRSGRSRFLIAHAWKRAGGNGAPIFQGAVDAQMQPLIGTLDPPEASTWWPSYGAEAAATALELKPASLCGLPAAALMITWGPRPPSVSPAVAERLARALAAAHPVTTA